MSSRSCCDGDKNTTRPTGEASLRRRRAPAQLWAAVAALVAGTVWLCSSSSLGLARASYRVQVKLSDYIGKKYVILFFYPLDFTFVYPTEITAFSDRHGEFERLNTEILGVSIDSVGLT